MTYRDEKGALQAKVGDLEGRLEVAEAEIAALRGTGTSVVREGETLGPRSGLGTPTSVRIEEVLDGTLTAEGYEAIASLLEKRLGLTSRQVGTKLETNALGSAAGGKVTITVREGRTHVVLEHDWSNRATGTWVLAGMAAAFGALATAAVMHDTMHLTDLMSAAQVLWAGPLIAGITALPIRGRAARHIERELATGRGTFTAMVELARTNLVARPRARVELAEDAAEAETAAETEADAALERS